MKRNDTTLGGSVGEKTIPERFIDEDRLVKRCDIRIRLSNEDTKISGSRGR
jgi:hypothetical protein